MKTGITTILRNIDSEDSGVFVPSAHGEIEQTDNNQSRHRAWMIHDYLKCPVIGTCLNPEKQRKILKKTGYSIKDKSSYEIHAMLVNSLAYENRISKRVDAQLNRKFESEISEFSDMEKYLFLDAWETSFKKGEIAGLLWVAATRSDFTEEDLALIFGDIHMAMHLNAEQNGKLRKKLSQEQEENKKLRQKLRDEIRIRRSLKKENGKSERELVELRQRYVSLKKFKLEKVKEISESHGNARLLDFEAENRQLRQELRDVSSELSISQKELRSMEHQNRKLLSKLEKKREMYVLLKDEMETNIRRISTLNQCDETCPSFDFCQRRILLVGGLTRMKSSCRELVEKSGGTFEHHNGNMKGGIENLRNQIKRADIVLCPVNINSHNACLQVKKLAKKYNKPFQMLNASGGGVISKALLEYQKTDPQILRSDE